MASEIAKAAFPEVFAEHPEMIPNGVFIAPDKDPA